MDRNYRRDDRRDDRRPREDTRNHKPRFEQNRSRSPARHDRRDDRRRSPPARGPPPPRGPGGPPQRSDQGREPPRRLSAAGGAPPRGPGFKGSPREPFDGRQNTAAPRRGPREIKDEDTKMDGPFEDEDSEAEMARVMGFKAFRTTQNTKVPGNDKNYGVHKNKKAEYRQYMNRVGGFNRPLDALP
ncbi:unnamed protein product [Zymoseptoria tritici ST99CH_3D1]|uniref:U4/U6.U5 small nuclear ribonucleoprotein 27kDa protein domain-containing protein n=1 Tax=Zymoseptoria tritici ST99CH_1E4 TaxID=1276532 RepID=A0A2H1FZU5_ZYMTR|nr:unnamed protein product [Zymoseptoria tritici ST99CH_1E4]SMR48052.1 unnamed protein product [Zymoseptoria tritici ST99CH_3D1]